ncbi:MAG TPA: hypothetical protein VFA45_00285 [Actinomycetes bacterium]|nr:hypothetical protein [Actinomycetes bacterium]
MSWWPGLDKTGTLTEGQISFQRALDPAGNPSKRTLLLGLACTQTPAGADEAAGANPLDVALWQAPGAARLPVSAYQRVAPARSRSHRT